MRCLKGLLALMGWALPGATVARAEPPLPTIAVLSDALGRHVEHALAGFAPKSDAAQWDTVFRDHAYAGAHATWTRHLGRVSGAWFAANGPADPKAPPLPGAIATMVGHFGAPCEHVTAALGTPWSSNDLAPGVVDHVYPATAHAAAWQNERLALRCIDGKAAGLVGSWLQRFDLAPVIDASRALRPKKGARATVLGLKPGMGLAAAIELLGAPTSARVVDENWLGEVRWGDIVALEVAIPGGNVVSVTITAPDAAADGSPRTLAAALEAVFGTRLGRVERDALVRIFDGQWPRDWAFGEDDNEQDLTSGPGQHRVVRRLSAGGFHIDAELVDPMAERLHRLSVRMPWFDAPTLEPRRGLRSQQLTHERFVAKPWPCALGTCEQDSDEMTMTLDLPQRDAALAAGARGAAIEALGKTWNEVVAILSTPMELSWRTHNDDATSTLEASWEVASGKVTLHFGGPRLVAERLSVTRPAKEERR
jgi:hypothetical protein